MRIRVTRRQIALGLVAIGGAAAAAFWVKGRDDGTSVELSLPPVDDPKAPTLEAFIALSQIILARPQVDAALARRMYPIFMDEPSGPNHIGATYAILRSAMARLGAGQSGRIAAPVEQLGSAQRWFVNHLVTTWYLGIYYHEQRPTQRIAYEDALLYEAMRGLVPKPFSESVGYGAWTAPPRGAERDQ